jgi:hypothetical protein
LPQRLPLWIAAGLVTVFYSSCGEGTAPVDIADSLRGPVSPHLLIPFEAYALTPEGLLRSHSASADRSGVDRPIVRTLSGNYLARNFAFEVSVTIPEAHEDIAYVGFGEGVANGAFHNEPTNAFLFRIHHIDSIRRIDTAVAKRDGGKAPLPHYATLDSVANYTPGRAMRFRIERRDEQVIMSVPELAGSERTFKLADFPGLFRGDRAYLFLGTTSQGTTFSELSVTS